MHIDRIDLLIYVVGSIIAYVYITSGAIDPRYPPAGRGFRTALHDPFVDHEPQDLLRSNTVGCHEDLPIEV